MNFDKPKNNIEKSNNITLSKEEFESITLFLKVNYNDLKDNKITITDKDLDLFVRGQKFFRDRIKKLNNSTIKTEDTNKLISKCKTNLQAINDFIRVYTIEKYGPYSDIINIYKDSNNNFNFRKFFDENSDKDHIIDFFKNFRSYEIINKNNLNLLNNEEVYLIKRSNPNIFL